MFFTHRSHERVVAALWGGGLVIYLAWADVSGYAPSLARLSGSSTGLMSGGGLDSAGQVFLAAVRYYAAWDLPLLVFAAVGTVLVFCLYRS